MLARQVGPLFDAALLEGEVIGGQGVGCRQCQDVSFFLEMVFGGSCRIGATFLFCFQALYEKTDEDP